MINIFVIVSIESNVRVSKCYYCFLYRSTRCINIDSIGNKNIWKLLSTFRQEAHISNLFSFYSHGAFINFFLFHSKDYYKLSLCVVISLVIYLTIYGSLEEHIPIGVCSINYSTIGTRVLR